MRPKPGNGLRKINPHSILWLRAHLRRAVLFGAQSDLYLQLANYQRPQNGSFTADIQHLQKFQSHVSAYERLLEALIMIGERLPVLDIRINTWSDSPKFQEQLIALYASMMKFWSQALKFRRHNPFLAIWSGYDVHFRELGESMNRHRKLLKECASALQETEGRDQYKNVQSTAVPYVLTRWQANCCSDSSVFSEQRSLKPISMALTQGP